MNKKGFTMLELLAVIIILSILITIGYMGVSQYLDQAYDATYSDFEENIEAGAANYLIEHTGSIPGEGESIVIDVSKLICDGYVKELQDPMRDGQTCDLNSYVIVKRGNNTNFNMAVDYEACLKCSNYESSACSNSISGLKRLTKDADCEVK